MFMLLLMPTKPHLRLEDHQLIGHGGNEEDYNSAYPLQLLDY